MQPYNQFQQDEQDWQAWVDMERWREAATRSYVTPAIIALVLYFCCYVPGLIANIVYLVAAWDTKQQVRRAPEGLGCLVALLLVFGIGPIAAFFLAYLMAMQLRKNNAMPKGSADPFLLPYYREYPYIISTKEESASIGFPLISA